MDDDRTPDFGTAEPITLRGGYATLDQRCDRIPLYDEQSEAYPIRPLFAAEDLREPRSYSWAYTQLDQGREGACTGFSVTMEAAARPAPYFGDPVRQPPDLASLDRIARDTYRRAQELDEWPGEEYEGSSVLAAMKAGQEQGWYDEYRWALGPGPEAAAQDVIMALGYFGPVVMGTYWFEDMYEPVGEEGFLDATGEPIGGHAYVLTRYSKRYDAVWTPNSWGGHGQGWIRRADLVKLLDMDGEACIPMKRNRRA